METNNLNITCSYRRLLEVAHSAGHQFFAFADQDDVWASDKMERAVTALQHVQGPGLYCARQTLVDADLQPIGVSPPFEEPIGFPAALTQNIASGCTIMLNRTAADLVLRTLGDQKYHDWWCYLIIAAAGGQIVADNKEVIQYRQHANNVIGAPASPLKRAMAALWRGPRAFMNILRDHVTMLQKHSALLSPGARHDLDVIATSLAGGPLGRRWALTLPGFRRQTLQEDALFRLWFIIG